MDRKTTKAYADIFRYIEANIVKLQPSSFTTDFEKATRNALVEVYGSDLQFITCWFHYCQAVRRRMSKLSALASKIKSNSNAVAEYFYQELLSLPLLPPSEIYLEFERIQKNIKESSLAKYFTPLLNYFKFQWFKKVSLNTIFVRFDINWMQL